VEDVPDTDLVELGELHRDLPELVVDARALIPPDPLAAGVTARAEQRQASLVLPGLSRRGIVLLPARLDAVQRLRRPHGAGCDRRDANAVLGLVIRAVVLVRQSEDRRQPD